MASRLVSTPIAAIRGAWKAISRSRKPRASMTPIASGAFVVSAASRSWFSAAGPPTRAPAGSSARSRSTVSPRAEVEGPRRGSLRSGRASPPGLPAPAAPPRSRIRAQHAPRPARGTRRVGEVHLQRARRPGAEGRRHLFVAEAGVVAVRHDLDRRHSGPQPERRSGEQRAAATSAAPPKSSGRRQSRSPQRAKRGRAVVAAVRPGQAQPVDPRAELGQHRRQQGQRRRQHEEDRDHDPERDRAEGGAGDEQDGRERDQHGQRRRRGPPCRRCPSSRRRRRPGRGSGRRGRCGSA